MRICSGEKNEDVSVSLFEGHSAMQQTMKKKHTHFSY